MRSSCGGGQAPVRGVIVGGPVVFWKRLESGLLFAINVTGSALALWWLATHEPTWIEGSFFLASLVVTQIGIGVGVHRYFAHKSFECGPAMQALLAAAGMMACQGSILKWVANHRRHHMHSDKPGDPHSPVVDGRGRPLALLPGLLHAHAGFLFDDTASDYEVYAKDMLQDPIVMFFTRTRWFWYALSFFILPGCYGYVLGGAEHAIGVMLTGGALRVFLVLNAITATGSIGHTWGRVRFEMPFDQSRNNAVIAFFTFGEGWHNNHHRHPKAAHIGLAWYEIDPNGAFIHLLARLGLAWNVTEHVAVARRALHPAAPA